MTLPLLIIIFFILIAFLAATNGEVTADRKAEVEEEIAKLIRLEGGTHLQVRFARSVGRNEVLEYRVSYVSRTGEPLRWQVLAMRSGVPAGLFWQELPAYTSSTPTESEERGDVGAASADYDALREAMERLNR